MDFAAIEERRAAAGIEQAELCRLAGVHTTTYSRQKRRPGRFGASELTLKRLSAALDQLAPVEGKGHGEH